MSHAFHVSSAGPLIEQVARLIRCFDRREKARLIQLVPDLQTIRPEEATSRVPAIQEELMTYFDAKLERHPELGPMQDEAPFVGGLTVAAFFALSDAEQARVWDRAYAEAERESANDAYFIREDALSSR